MPEWKKSEKIEMFRKTLSSLRVRIDVREDVEWWWIRTTEDSFLKNGQNTDWPYFVKSKGTEMFGAADCPLLPRMTRETWFWVTDEHYKLVGFRFSVEIAENQEEKFHVWYTIELDRENCERLWTWPGYGNDWTCIQIRPWRILMRRRRRQRTWTMIGLDGD